MVSSLITWAVKLIIPIFLGTTLFHNFGGSHLRSQGSQSSSSTIRSTIAPYISLFASSGSMSLTLISSSDSLPSDCSSFKPESESHTSKLSLFASPPSISMPAGSLLTSGKSMLALDWPTLASGKLMTASAQGVPALGGSTLASDCWAQDGLGLGAWDHSYKAQSFVTWVLHFFFGHPWGLLVGCMGDKGIWGGIYQHAGKHSEMVHTVTFKLSTTSPNQTFFVFVFIPFCIRYFLLHSTVVLYFLFYFSLISFLPCVQALSASVTWDVGILCTLSCGFYHGTQNFGPIGGHHWTQPMKKTQLALFLCHLH